MPGWRRSNSGSSALHLLAFLAHRPEFHGRRPVGGGIAPGQSESEQNDEKQAERWRHGG
jgi:hypothetical protein